MRELVEITEEARDGNTASLRAHHEDFLTRFLNAQEENDAADPESRCFSSRNHFRKICHGHIESDLLDKLTGVTKVWCENGSEVYTRKPGATALIAAHAARQAEVICVGFAEKILGKLAPIVEGKGKYRGMDVIGRTIRPDIVEDAYKSPLKTACASRPAVMTCCPFSDMGHRSCGIR